MRYQPIPRMGPPLCASRDSNQTRTHNDAPLQRRMDADGATEGGAGGQTEVSEWLAADFQIWKERDTEERMSCWLEIGMYCCVLQRLQWICYAW